MATDPQPPEAADLLDRRRHSLAATYRLFYDDPVELVRGEGTWLFDAHGRQYLDAYNNVAVVGHCRPEVVDAIARQAARLNTHTRYLSAPIVAYAEALLAQFTDDLDRVIFTCSGSESNDLACRIARDWTGGDGFIVTANAYHGTTTMAAALSPSLHDRPDPRVYPVTAPNPSAEGDAAAQRFADDITAAVGRMQRDGRAPAALIIDTIMSSEGVHADPTGLLGPAVDAIHAAGGLFIADEVQAGFGRLGTGMWGFARHHLAPDLVTLGKPMGNGHPIAGLVGRQEIFDHFGARMRYFNTFAGNPVSAAAGHAVLDILEKDHLAEHAETVGAELRAALDGVAAKHDVATEVRGAGLFYGMQLETPDGDPGTHAAKQVINEMRNRGVLISATGPHTDVLKIRPPLVFSADEIPLLATALDESLAATEHSPMAE